MSLTDVWRGCRPGIAVLSGRRGRNYGYIGVLIVKVLCLGLGLIEETSGGPNCKEISTSTRIDTKENASRQRRYVCEEVEVVVANINRAKSE